MSNKKPYKESAIAADSLVNDDNFNATAMKHFIFFAILNTVIAIFPISNASALTLNKEQQTFKTAYDKINVVYHTFKPYRYEFTLKEQRYLQQIFTLSNQMTVLRVALQEDIKKQCESIVPYSIYKEKSHQIIQKFGYLKPPKKLRAFHALLMSGIDKEQGYYRLAYQQMCFTKMKDKSFAFNQEEADKLKIEEQALAYGALNDMIEAYNLLIAEYPGLDRHNKKAFYAVLSALSVI